MTAVELQDKKCILEVKIERLLADFNEICVANDWQVDSLIMRTEGADADRIFSVDIQIQ